ncbi:MAG: SUMF1/EgtB/PvdO family nonheme iron enzyme [Gammaproteobacteria bacterium]|nr:SUMF1/EgtB/PvdO family nonheme iron enzyme [Gammaproteobacteria bacterium]
MPPDRKGTIDVGTAINSPLTITNITVNGTVLSAAEVQRREQHYLRRVIKDCAGLEWLSLMHLQDENSQGLELDAVYTALLTNTVDSLGRVQPGKSEQPPLSALEVLNRERYLVLTGDPGSGKSAFVNYLCLCLAGESLGSERLNLQALTAPLPDDEGEPQTEATASGDEAERWELRQHWDHGALIPVRIILRDFSASSHFPAENERATASHLLDFLRTTLNNAACEEYWDGLKARLRDGKALVMFDGLDEVAQAGERRTRLLACIEDFARSHAENRLLVTCRPYAYHGSAKSGGHSKWRLERFAVSHLAPFGRGQMICFIRRWYASLTSQSVRTRGEKLQKAVLSRTPLRDLAKRPLLLSLIAYLHAYRHELPERRADLYEKLLELLLDKWEKARFNTKDSDDARQLAQYSLAEFLQVGQDRIRLVLEKLAFLAHAAQDPQQRETADITARDLIFELASAARVGGRQVDEWEVCDYLRDRVGILYQRGGASELDAVYTFPHRSFQEYLAAAYLRREEDALFGIFKQAAFELGEETVWQELAAALGRSDPDRWREVVVLAGGINALSDPGPIWELLDALSLEADPAGSSRDAWGLRLAAEILAECLKRDNLNRRQQRITAQIRAALPAALRTPHLPAVERAAIGNHLAVIGDPRAAVMTVDAMPFCQVPKGRFWMGKGRYDEKGEEWRPETPAGEYDLTYDYQLAQYPVTVAQFGQFVEDAQFELDGQRALQGAPNSPVVWVSRDEAMEFCRWLTRRWHKSGRLADDLCVTLPDEAEWERAARGGLADNPEPQRCYPWKGNEITDEHLNYNGHIGEVTTPGIYPLGESPCGCHDLSGNVWEWTRSAYGEYPYPAVGTNEWKKRTNGLGAVGVLRGGAFNYYRRLVRCAVRYFNWLDLRSDGIGFRCCVVPMTLVSEDSGR